MRQLFAALALGFLFVANPVQAAAPTTTFQIAESPDKKSDPKKDDKPGNRKDKSTKPKDSKTNAKPDSKKGNVLSNILGTKVAFNPQTKKYHVKGCRYYDGKTNVMMSVADAKKKGGQPCQICQKGKK